MRIAHPLALTIASKAKISAIGLLITRRKDRRIKVTISHILINCSSFVNKIIFNYFHHIVNKIAFVASLAMHFRISRSIPQVEPLLQVLSRPKILANQNNSAHLVTYLAAIRSSDCFSIICIFTGF